MPLSPRKSQPKNEIWVADIVRSVIESCGFEMIVNGEPTGDNHCAWLHVVSNEQLDALPIN